MIDTTEGYRSKSGESPPLLFSKIDAFGAISLGAVPRFRKRFEEVYGGASKTELIVGAAAAHHRQAWIHPFVDGNGRVARLMSHAMLLELLDTGAVWSVASQL